MHMDLCMRAYSTVQQFLCLGSYCELILSLARTSCRLLFTARPPACPLACNPLRDAVRSRNPSKSTLAHDAVATAVLHKHHPFIRVGAGLIHFLYRSHLRLALETTRNRNAFSPFFARVFYINTKWNLYIYTEIHTYPHVNPVCLYGNIHTHTRELYVHIRTCIHPHTSSVSIHVNAYTHTSELCVHTRKHSHVVNSVSIYAITYTHMYFCACVRKHIHTHVDFS